MIEEHGEQISGRIVKRSATRQGRTPNVFVWIRPEGGHGDGVMYKLSPELARVDLRLQSQITARHSDGVLYEILSIDGQAQPVEQPSSREWVLNVSSSVTVVSALLVIVGPLLILNSLLNVPLILPYMVVLGFAIVGFGVVLYKSVSRVAAVLSFSLNIASMMVWVVTFNEIGSFSPPGVYVGLATIIIQIVLILYFLCSMNTYE
jgi:hypothetical protein